MPGFGENRLGFSVDFLWLVLLLSLGGGPSCLLPLSACAVLILLERVKMSTLTITNDAAAAPSERTDR